MKKLSIFFVYITTAFFVMGAIMNITDNTFDIYQFWVLVAFLIASYLIYQGDK